MASEALDFRESCVDTLRFLASCNEQREFATRVHYDDYEAEFASWWFDDLAFENLHSNTVLLQQSFSKIEIAALQKFTDTFDRLDRNLSSADRTINELLDHPDWIKVTEAAAEVLDSVPTFAT